MPIKISKATKTTVKIKGTPPKSRPNETIKPAIIFKIICPTVILATKRIVKLKGFDNNEIISIGTINGAINKGTPLGKKVLKYTHFCLLIPMQIFKISANNDKVPTAAICDVNVKL